MTLTLTKTAAGAEILAKHGAFMPHNANGNYCREELFRPVGLTQCC